MGVTLTADGTTTVDGSSLRRYQGALDWKKLAEWLTSGSELSRQFFKGADSIDGSGTAEVLIDAGGFPRRINMHLDLSAGGREFAVDESSRSRPLPDDTRIDLPAPSEVAKTVPVHSAAEYSKALNDVIRPGGN